MARKSGTSLDQDKSPWTSPAPKIHLTLKQGLSGQVVVDVSINEFIAYSQNSGFTRLNLTGGKVLEVKETTDQIDRLVRAASSQPNPSSRRVTAAGRPFHRVSDTVVETISVVQNQAELPGMPQSSNGGLHSLLTG
jgi:hypothetical protein